MTLTHNSMTPLASWGRHHQMPAHARSPVESIEPELDAQQTAPLTRAELRQERENVQRQQRLRRGPLGLLLKWWVYPIVVAIGVCIYLGVQSASTPLPSRNVIVVTTEPAP